LDGFSVMISARNIRIILALLAALALLQARVALAGCALPGLAPVIIGECCDRSGAAMSDAGDTAAQLCSKHCLRPSARSENGSGALIQSSKTQLPGPSAISTDWARTESSQLESFAEPRANGQRIIYEMQRLLI
jgi:hypothetical protein